MDLSTVIPARPSLFFLYHSVPSRTKLCATSCSAITGRAKVQQPVGQTQEAEKSQQVVGQTEQPVIPHITLITWGHNIAILAGSPLLSPWTSPTHISLCSSSRTCTVSLPALSGPRWPEPQFSFGIHD